MGKLGSGPQTRQNGPAWMHPGGAAEWVVGDQRLPSIGMPRDGESRRDLKHVAGKLHRAKRLHIPLKRDVHDRWLGR